MKTKRSIVPFLGTAIFIAGIIPVWQFCSYGCTGGNVQYGLLSVGLSLLVGYGLRRAELLPKTKTAFTYLAAAILVPAMMIAIPASYNGWMTVIMAIPAGITGLILATIGLIKLAQNAKDMYFSDKFGDF